MANPFDQFHAAEQPASNAFDGFDEKPSVAADVGKAAVTGTAKAAISIPGLPGDVQKMSDSVVDRIMLGVAHKAIDWTGYGPQAGAPERDRFDTLWNQIGSHSNLPTSADIQGGVEKVTGPFPKSQTVAGKFTEAIISNAPAAAIGGGGVVARTANVIVPAVMSEGAGELSAGSKFEPLVRVLGGLFGNGDRRRQIPHDGAGAHRARSDRRRNARRFDTAADLQRRAATVGVPISGPEAVQAATNGATRLGDVQRVVENFRGWRGADGALLLRAPRAG
ncbi:hypothetical protein N2605_26925 [Bradyrhizobium yuanmingense]|uniref:hypothetical protein n=1 Tax=Bradyrhizobium yuanmingense TaxID=108015 RepID=UPI0021A2D21D|nr:hypothetical protein [Bradyrhizobium sp. CB1024]UWU83158.1 hypothetical protein N2605_26925 [Bradyrhizobium sp. CB1024]